MSVFRSDLDLDARDATGTGAEADVALNLATGNTRLSIFWTQDIQLSADDADQVAEALQRAAAESRSLLKGNKEAQATEDSSGPPAA
ncbi:hypothetical protein OG352_23115 [Streptomyces sp. NBC_01485]|uniref:hypothetical protein n=1 Tax=Streptomyces sp. NBC_01485 TaxID=2903884 RepID=UPI002E30F53B|nr:hypothetical protein [Streptomyces sp. NBC_01485]